MKTMFTPLVAVIALGVGTLFGLTQAEIKTLEDGILTIATGVATLVSVYGVIKSHKKKAKKIKKQKK